MPPAGFVSLFCLLLAQQPPVDQGHLIHEVSRSHTQTQHIRYISSGRVIISSYRPLPDNIQHSQQTDIHALGGIRTHNHERPQTYALDRAVIGTGIVAY